MSLLKLCELCYVIEASLYAQLSILVHRALDISGQKRMQVKAVVLAGEYSTDNYYLKKKIANVCSMYQLPCISTFSALPATQVAWTAWQYSFEQPIPILQVLVVSSPN